MNLQKLTEKILEIKNKGFIRTRRINDTGIGKTLEDLLGIKENNLKVPDVGEIELKAKRIDSQSMLTIATKAPKPRGANRRLFEEYKYKDEEGCYCLYSTVYGSRYNPQGFKINVSGDRIELENVENIEVYWPVTIFYDVLKSKSDKMLLVFAETEGERRTQRERFRFTEAHLLSDLNIDKFKKAIQDDKLKIDIRIGVYRSGPSKGMYHDHGTGFRIHKRDFSYLYDNYQQII